MVGNANDFARLKGHRGPLCPSPLLSPSPVSEVLFNARGGEGRHTNSTPFANAERLPKTIQDSFMQCTEYSSSKVRLFPLKRIIIYHEDETRVTTATNAK